MAKAQSYRYPRTRLISFLFSRWFAVASALVLLVKLVQLLSGFGAPDDLCSLPGLAIFAFVMLHPIGTRDYDGIWGAQRILLTQDVLCIRYFPAALSASRCLDWGRVAELRVYPHGSIQLCEVRAATGEHRLRFIVDDDWGWNRIKAKNYLLLAIVASAGLVPAPNSIALADFPDGPDGFLHYLQPGLIPEPKPKAKRRFWFW